jgi:hypothetical protein
MWGTGDWAGDNTYHLEDSLNGIDDYLKCTGVTPVPDLNIVS